VRLYVASSWRNPHQPDIVRWLRELGHETYDFRHPPAGDHLGFSWSDVDPGWTSWSPEQYREALDHPIALAGFESDFGAMEWAEGCVLVLPCGRSAHLEAGWFVGAGKPLWILLDPDEFGIDAGHHVTELMYRMATGVCTGLDEVVDGIAAFKPDPIVHSVSIVVREQQPVSVHATREEAYEDLNIRTEREARPDLDAIYSIEDWLVQDKRNLKRVPQDQP
jgi:hypothetical protein